jgi:GH24 family phage-related lysozyme (muramidase)
MNYPLSTLELLKEIIKEFEGCRLEAYLCPAGVWTIGYGATGKGIVKGTKWTQGKADDMLHYTAFECINDAIKESPILANESHEKQAAIADFVYNLGITRYRSSTLKKRVDAGDWNSAAGEILRWDKVKGKPLAGLTRRRKREAELLY